MHGLPQGPSPAASLAPQVPAEDGPGVEELVEEDLLVEDVSIDGMCGVY